MIAWSISRKPGILGEVSLPKLIARDEIEAIQNAFSTKREYVAVDDRWRGPRAFPGDGGVVVPRIFRDPKYLAGFDVITNCCLFFLPLLLCDSPMTVDGETGPSGTDRLAPSACRNVSGLLTALAVSSGERTSNTASMS